jgi:hypothetical protein
MKNHSMYLCVCMRTCLLSSTPRRRPPPSMLRREADVLPATRQEDGRRQRGQGRQNASLLRDHVYDQARRKRGNNNFTSHYTAVPPGSAHKQ